MCWVSQSCVPGKSSVWTLKSPRMMMRVIVAIATWNPEGRCRSMVRRGLELHQDPGGSILILLFLSTGNPIPFTVDVWEGG